MRVRYYYLIFIGSYLSEAGYIHNLAQDISNESGPDNEKIVSVTLRIVERFGHMGKRSVELKNILINVFHVKF